MNETEEMDDIFSALPIDAQQRFERQWAGIVSEIESRRGPMANAVNWQLMPFIEMLIKSFYVSGYSAALDAEKVRNAELRKTITEKCGQYLQHDGVW